MCKRITTSENLLFQILIAFTHGVFAGTFVHNDIISADPVICESFNLPVLMLFPAGNTSVAECSIVHKNTPELSQKALPLLKHLKSQKQTF